MSQEAPEDDSELGQQNLEKVTLIQHKCMNYNIDMLGCIKLLKKLNFTLGS